MRKETTINNTRDFGIGKRIHNLPALREVGFQANRRLLETERISHDCIMAEEAFQKLNRPVQAEAQRASALRFADSKVQALWNALLVFRFSPRGFSNAQLRRNLAELLGKRPDQITAGAMTYQLRRLRLHGTDTTHPENSSLSSYRSWLPCRPVLFEGLFQNLTARHRVRFPQCRRNRFTTSPCLSQRQRGGSKTGSKMRNLSQLENLTHSLQLLLFKAP